MEAGIEVKMISPDVHKHCCRNRGLWAYAQPQESWALTLSQRKKGRRPRFLDAALLVFQGLSWGPSTCAQVPKACVV